MASEKVTKRVRVSFSKFVQEKSLPFVWTFLILSFEFRNYEKMQN